MRILSFLSLPLPALPPDVSTDVYPDKYFRDGDGARARAFLPHKYHDNETIAGGRGEGNTRALWIFVRWMLHRFHSPLILIPA